MKLKKVKYTKTLKKTCKSLNCQKRAVHTLLKKFDFPRTERPNVLRPGQTNYEGFVLGVVNTRGLVGWGQILSVKTQHPRYR